MRRADDWLTPTGVDLWRGLPARAKCLLVAYALALGVVAATWQAWWPQ